MRTPGNAHSGRTTLALIPALVLGILLVAPVRASTRGQLSARLELMNHVAQTDADLISQINDQRNLLQQRQVILQQEETHLQGIKTDLSHKQQALDQKLAAAQAVVDRLNADKASALR